MADEANPVDFLPNHSHRTELEQLQAALDAGLITPALFALAKEKLLNASAPPPPEAPPQPSRPAAQPAPQNNEASSGELPPLMSFFNDTAPTPPSTPAAPPTPAPARVTPSSVPSQPESRPSSPPLASAESPPVTPTPRQPVTPPTPTPKPAVVDFMGTSTTPAPPMPAPRPASTPNFILSQPDVYSDLLATPAPTPPPPTRPSSPIQAAAPAPSRSVMPKVLLALGIVGLLLLIYWQVSGSHPDEQLTSPRLPATSETTAPPTVAKAPTTKKRSGKASKSKKHKGKKNKALIVNTDSVGATPLPPKGVSTNKAKVVAATAKPIATTKPATTPADTYTPPDEMPRAVPPAPEAGDTEAATKVRTTMAGYYADMLAPPFTAARHFAPRVERLYIQQNLTPADIDDRFNRNFFPDNKQAVLRIEPGTLRVSAPAADGTCMATFVEDSRVFHPSRQVYQRMRAQVRARFDADFKIIYLRQERLLESIVE